MATITSAPKKKSGIDARAAADAAVTYFRRLYPQLVTFSLEEVELTEDGNYWLITLGFEAPQTRPALEFLQPPKTKFKIFKVDETTGEVVSMKIRRLE